MESILESDGASEGLAAWKPIVLGAMAGGLGWGIRGQYGHETGAMIAGLLVSLVLTWLLRPGASSLAAARAVAWCALGIGIGGSMTYGQTVGLTHDQPLVGNWAALRWGLLGLAVKGGLWIGFGGTLLGMGWGGKRYGVLELIALWSGLLGLCALGIWALNLPFDPAHHILPGLYFSDDWRWEPGSDLKPRREVWGGLLVALVGLLVYLGGPKRDWIAVRLGLFGILGGALGFPLGQSLQAYHAWNPGVFQSPFWRELDLHMNWWNHMETTFGATMGGCLGLGAWLLRRSLPPLDEPPPVTLRPLVEGAILVVHTSCLALVELVDLGGSAPGSTLDALYDFGLILVFLPILATAGGRWSPYLLALPVTLLPIAGKTFRNLALEEQATSRTVALGVYVALPLSLALWAAVDQARKSSRKHGAKGFLRNSLLLSTWLYFGLNFAFFRFPWPWAEWTSRTPNALVFTVCALGLTAAALLAGPHGTPNRQSPRACVRKLEGPLG